MTVKHTPGPLHVEAGGGRYDDDGEWDSVVIVPDADNETMLAELLWRKGDVEAEAQTRADAVLFAAAPALADALEWALREIARPVGWDGPDADYEKAEAAIRAAGRLP